MLDQGRDCPAPEEAARDYVDPEKGVETLADALQGANDIVAELLSDDAAIRKTLRELLRRQGHLRSLAATEEDTVYRLYYDFDQPSPSWPGTRSWPSTGAKRRASSPSPCCWTGSWV